MIYVKITFDNPSSGVYRCECPIVQKFCNNSRKPNPEDGTTVYMEADDGILDSDCCEEITEKEFNGKIAAWKIKHKELNPLGVLDGGD